MSCDLGFQFQSSSLPGPQPGAPALQDRWGSQEVAGGSGQQGTLQEVREASHALCSSLPGKAQGGLRTKLSISPPLITMQTADR